MGALKTKFVAVIKRHKNYADFSQTGIENLVENLVDELLEGLSEGTKSSMQRDWNTHAYIKNNPHPGITR